VVQDDHGHSYHIKDFPSKEEAEKYLEELDRRNTTHVGQGHKQHYWIEWKPSPPRPTAV
jgi:viroplasmin and RNaseH domain-containing protein